MNVTFSCPRCQQPARAQVPADAAEITCSACGRSIGVPPGALDDGHLRRCLVCPSTDLYVRKDFPQQVGVAIVIAGIIGSSIAWAYTYTIATFAILFATALVDVVLYLIVPDALMCYRCGATYRTVRGMDRHEAFNLETHERYRQQAARMAEHSR